MTEVNAHEIGKRQGPADGPLDHASRTSIDTPLSSRRCAA